MRGSGKCCGIFFRPCLSKAFVFLVVLILAGESAEAQPSLLPKPHSVRWNSDRFVLQEGDPEDDPRIRLSRVEKVPGAELNMDEAYRISVSNDSVVIEATGEEGFFRARSTLRQLVVPDGNGNVLNGCSITDWPAYRIRGYMHDAGRFFIPIDELRREVELLSQLKINTFHWHLTEDIAWRLESERFSRMTDKEIDLRNGGSYYSRKEVGDFLEFCKDHFIDVIPEIDMPGHSDAFRRATGFSMQSERGKEILKVLLHEACELFDGPYFHIGTDEVQISDSLFVREMAEIVRSHGKEVIGWLPGAVIDDRAIRQLWADITLPPGIVVIDSRYRYLNHTDPYSDLFAVYNSRICDSEKGSPLLAGGICCLWNDRKPSSVDDIIISNTFYPMMFAFAERSWLGGGENIKQRGVRMGLPGDPVYERFRDFETRMTEVRNRMFPDIPFPYLPQSDILWNISNPLPNLGNLSATFPGEEQFVREPGHPGTFAGFSPAAGAAVYLRHTWGNKVPSFYSDPLPDHTTFAYTWVYSPVAREAGLIFSTHNYGRSERDASPPPGKWDYSESRVWFNGKPVEPPEWKRPGFIPEDLETPYMDENFWNRPPVAISLNEGWNSIVMKLPVGSFSTPETRLVKWMFTAMVVEPDAGKQPDGLVYSPDRMLPGERKKIACIGNSVTYGAGIADRETNSYPAVLQAMLGPEYIVGNFGRSGATLLKKAYRPYCLTEEFASVLSFRPEIAVIHLGLNDTDPRAWPDYRDEFISDFLWLIDTLRAAGTKEFYIAKLSPIFSGHRRFKAGTRDWYWQIQERIEEVARLSGATLVDFYSPLKDRPDLLPDNLHPDKRGAGIIAQSVYSAVTGDYDGLQLPAGWGDNMVLQHGRIVRLSGLADRDEVVTATIAGKSYTAMATPAGRWETAIEPLKPGGPYELVVRSSKDTIVIRNILAGEVWLCSGQSNMEWSLVNSSGWEEIRDYPEDDYLRIINFRRRPLDWSEPWDSTTLQEINELDFFENGVWSVGSPATAPDFSALAWYFGRRLRAELDVPVGLIEIAVGGSPAESWIERKALEMHPQLADLLHDYRRSEFQDKWVRDVISKTLEETDDPRQRHPFEPAYLFESGLSLLAGFPIRGFLWYQGESNAGFPELYEVILPELVRNWRDAWNDNNLPFYFAQLSSLDRPSWPAFRDAQRRLSSMIPQSAMIVTADVGHPSDVHPRDKKTVGERFASLALTDTYGMKKFHRSPEPFKAELRGGEVIVTFSHTGKLRTSDGLPPRELEISESGEYFRLVTAVIRGNRLIIGSPGAVSVRYGWKPFTEGNITGGTGLPVSTFKLNINQ